MLATLLITQVVGLLFLYWLLSRRIRRATDVTAHVAALRAEVGGLVAELNGTTDRNVRLLEDRVATVNELVEKLDRKLRVLRRESARAMSPVVTVVPSERGDTATPVPATPAPVLAAAEGGAATPPPEQALAAAPPSSDSARLDQDPTGEGGAAEQSQTGHIARLHRSGLIAAEIAQRLGVDVGEVELVIALRAGER